MNNTQVSPAGRVMLNGMLVKVYQLGMKSELVDYPGMVDTAIEVVEKERCPVPVREKRRGLSAVWRWFGAR